MNRHLVAGVIAMTLAVTGSAYAEGAHDHAPAKDAHEAAPAAAKDAHAAPKDAHEAPPAPAPAKDAHEAAPAPAAAKDPHEAAAAAKEEPLALRPSKPLTLASEPASTPWYVKLGFVAAVAGAGFVAWKKRKKGAQTASSAKEIKVLTKTSMGLRGELALVEVGGMKLLVGVTASSMQTLAILPEEDEEAETTAAREERETREERAAAATTASRAARTARTPATRRDGDIATRARSLLSQLELAPESTPHVVPPPLPPATAFSASRYAEERDTETQPDSGSQPAATAAKERAPRKRTKREAPVEGQARGIALAVGNRR